MKNKHLFTLLFLSIIITFSSCKDDDASISPSSSSTSSNPNFSCRIDGELWDTDPRETFVLYGDTMKVVDFYMDNEYLDFDVLLVKGEDSSLIEGTVMIDRDDLLGTYSLSFDDNSDNNILVVKHLDGLSMGESYETYAEASYGDQDLSIAPGTQTGTFNITAFDKVSKKMSGNFSFSQVSSIDIDPPLATINVTEGVFTEIEVVIDL